MPELTEFEEKEYENPLNHQLLLSSNNIWTPGQVFEKVFGIDAAIFAMDYPFWKLFGSSTIPSGVSLDSYRWNYRWRFIHRTIKKFPSFKVNLLIQAKRPSYRFGINAQYAKNGIKNHYWQFKITPHQQRILEKLETKLGTDALVIYACPSFHKFAELDNFISNGNLVSNSTFVKPSKLKGHTKWVYDQPGTNGLACSKIDKQTDKKFEDQIEDLFSLTNNDITKSSDEVLSNLLRLENISLEICNELKDENPIAIAYLKRRQITIDDFNERNFQNINFDIYRSYSSFEIFTSILNTSWLTL
jgi:hypothetical protein